MSTNTLRKKTVLQELSKIVDDKTGRGIVEGELVESVSVDGGKVKMRLHYRDERPAAERWELEDRVYQAVESIDGVSDVTIDVTVDEGSQDSQPQEPKPEEVDPRKPIPGVGKIIAVASGKGGVGKSTVACNLALALSKKGFKTGLLDVDIYGPSVPTLLGVHEQPRPKGKIMSPVHAHGLNIMSLGFLIPDDRPVIWRGPMVTSAIQQFLYQVDWAGTDYLVIDLPPGTGDAQLSLAQAVPIDGVIIVTTPSDLALIDAARGIQMFRILNVDILGVIENMSYFVCSDCGKTHHIFGEGGAEREATRLDTRLLGRVPLDSRVRSEGDSGRPIILVDEESEAVNAFLALADEVTSEKPLARSEG